MFSSKLLITALAVCQGFNIPVPNGQAVLDIDIHINSNSQDDMSMHSDGMSMRSDDMPVNSEAVRAQYSRGMVAATSVEPYDSFLVVGVGANAEAYVTLLNDTAKGWYPSNGNFFNLGGEFNRSLAVYSFDGSVYIAGTTRTGNLVLKNFMENGILYPKTKSWILLAEGVADGTPSIASHDNKTISVVVRQKDGSLLHEIFDPETDGQSVAKIPNKKFASNPALLVRPDNKLQVYATDAEGQMHFSEWKSGNTWTAWTPLGGDFVGDPATKWLGPKGDIWSVGKDGNVYARYFSEKDCFAATWISVGGVNCLNTGALHYWGNNWQYADFFCQSTGDVKMIRRDGDKLTASSIGGVIMAAPSVFDLHWKKRTFSDVMAIGMDGSLFRKQREGETWGDWGRYGGSFQQ